MSLSPKCGRQPIFASGALVRRPRDRRRCVAKRQLVRVALGLRSWTYRWGGRMGLAIMIIGLAVFLGSHTLVALRPHRAAVIARIGEGPYKGLFSLVSLVGILLIGYGFALYRANGYIDIWMPPRWTRHVTELLVWPAIIAIVAAYIPGEIKRVLKHPMLVGVKLWAVA